MGEPASARRLRIHHVRFLVSSDRAGENPRSRERRGDEPEAVNVCRIQGPSGIGGASLPQTSPGGRIVLAALAVGASEIPFPSAPCREMAA